MAQFGEITTLLVKFERGEITDINKIIKFAEILRDNGMGKVYGGRYSKIVGELISRGKIEKDPRLKLFRFCDELFDEN